MSDNPYLPPQTETDLIDVSGGGPDPKLDRSVSMLRQTKPWVRFISVMMFIGSAFLVLGGLFIIAAGAGGFGGGLQGVGLGTSVGVIYMVMAIFYIIPAILLWRYADRIAVFVRQESTAALASALEAQKSFWKFVGILMLVIIVIYVLIFVVAIVGGVLTAM